MSEQSYYNDFLQFYLEIPTGWSFLPTQWASNSIQKTAHANESLRELLEQAKTPFVYMQKPSACDALALPTAKVSCLSVSRPDNKKRAHFLDIQVNMLSKFEDFTLVSKDQDCVIAGHPAMSVKCEFLMRNENDAEFRCLSHLWTLFDEHYAFAIGLSGAPENVEYYRADHQAILQSIRLGAAY